MLPGPPLAALLFGPGPKVVTFHRAGADAIYKAAGKALGPIVSSRTAAATVVSLAALETARDALGGFMPRAVEIPNGVDTRRYSAAAARHARAVASGERYRSGRTPTVAFVGRHERRKGLSVLIEALPLLPPQLEVVIAGSGAETDGGRRRTADDGRVHFVGRLDDMALASLLARADIVVAPALSGESFGLVLLEAMAAGAVVVASSIHGYAAAAGDAALLVPPAQPGALAEAVTKLIDDDARRAEMAARGLARAEEFSLARVAHRYREVYEVVISS
jgi:phosphatidylinositol alpha-mannosyltransferase